MRIDFVTDTFPPDINGVAMTLGRFVDGLRANGHLVHVYHTADRPKQKGETPLPSIPLPGYKEVRMGLPGWFKLFNQWKKKRPDVVYVATETPLGLSAMQAAASLGIPVAAGFHTNFDQYLETYKLEGFKPAALAYLKNMHSKATCTFAPSPEVIDRLKEEGFEDVRLLGRGVDTELFSPTRRSPALRESWGAEEGDLVCLYVGRVSTEKNMPLSFQAYHAIKKKYPSTKMVVVGDGPEKESYVREYPDVIWAGMQRDENLAEHYASADLFLFASETETYGNVVMEALGAGILTLSYDYAAPKRFVEHGKNGFKVPLGDEAAFIKEAERLVELTALEDVKKAARATAENLSWEQVILDFQKNLKNLTLSSLNARIISRKKSRVIPYRSIFISDLHLGGEHSKVNEVVDFLRHTTCEKLYLNGDIIDGWALKRGADWKKRYTRFIRTIIHKIEKEKGAVIYLRGNHDEILDQFLPLAFGSFQLQKEAIHVGVDGKRYLVVHGDEFDRISTNYKWMAFLGSMGYNFLLKINRFYNRLRAIGGKDYRSISKDVKARVKNTVASVDKYQEILHAHAKKMGYDGVICGHVHTAADKMIDDVRYLNTGDWVESMTAIVEHLDGKLEILRYEEFLRDLLREDLELQDDIKK